MLAEGISVGNYSLVFHLRVQGLVLSDPELLDRLDWAEADIYPSDIDGLSLLTVRSVTPVPDAVDFVLDAVSHLASVAPGVTVEGIDQDLVGATDIATRVGVSREMARLWTTGGRGPGGFPSPLGVVNGGRRVWDWASVNDWLLTGTDHGQPESGLTRSEYARVEALLRCRAMPTLSGSWLGGSVVSATDARLARLTWSPTQAHRMHAVPASSPRVQVRLAFTGAANEEQVIRRRAVDA